MLVTKKQIADVLGVSVSTIDRLMAKGLPYIKIERSVRFDKDVVMDWIKNRK